MDEPTNAPIGTDPVGGGGAEPTTPTAIDVTDDTLLNVQGHDKPVRYADLYKSQQADYTKKTQQLAADRKAWDSDRQKQTEAIRAREAQLQQLAAELMQQRRQASAGPDLASQLSSMKYIDGQTGAAMLQAFQDKGLKPIVEAIKQRDEKINLLSGQLAQMNTALQQMQGTHTSAQFDSQIKRAISEAGLPEGSEDFARSVYLSYEPTAELNAQFPEILKQHWEGVTTAFERSRQAKAEAAKRDLAFPGKGGTGTAGKPIGLTGKESPREAADALWERLQAQQSQET